MAFTFSPALDTTISQVRQKIGDTNPEKPEIQDETITAYLDSGKSVLRTAATLASDLAAKYARMVQVNVDRQLMDYSSIYKHYKDLAATLLAEANREPTPPPAGLSVGGVGVGGIMVMGLDEPRRCLGSEW